MTDLKVAWLRAHGNNISRYRRLLETNLSELERRFLEKRLSEEQAAIENLASTRFPNIELSSDSIRAQPALEALSA